MALTWGPNLNDQVSAAGLRYKPAKRYWLNGSVNLELGAQYAVTKDEKVHPWPEYRKSATPGQSLSIWQFLSRRKAGSGTGPLLPGVEWLAQWEPVGQIVVTGGNDTDDQVRNTAENPSGSKDRRKGKNGKNGKNGDDTKDATFVSTEGWQIKANAPMLSVNYPDEEFLALQTAPYQHPQVNKNSTKRNKNFPKVKGEGSDMSKKGKGGKLADWAKADPKKNRKTVTRRKITTVPETVFPSNKVRLGYIEQDAYLHSDLASLQGVQSSQKAKGKDKTDNGGHRWRFKFHYNPATVGVSQSYQTEIDPLFLPKDPAASIVSGSQVSFSLVLNRIEEMQILNLDGSFRKGKDGSTASDDEYVKWAWRHARVSSATRRDIRTKGTLYDLEYLYRVCNGEPRELWKGTSADYGILFGQPLRLHFTNIKSNGMQVGMNYYGFISSIDIQHQMFSMDMVPSLTTVGISFSRIPDTLALDSKKVGEAFAK